MKLISSVTPKPGTIWYKFVEFFCNHINWCHGYYYGTDIEKPENKLYSFVYKYWTFPFENPGCECCSAVRGLIYGGIIGFVLGKVL